MHVMYSRNFDAKCLNKGTESREVKSGDFVMKCMINEYMFLSDYSVLVSKIMNEYDMRCKRVW